MTQQQISIEFENIPFEYQNRPKNTYHEITPSDIEIPNDAVMHRLGQLVLSHWDRNGRNLSPAQAL